MEAALAQARGRVAGQPCASCVRGGGPFTECVVVAGQLSGSCANCHYGSEGARCSFRACKQPQRPATERAKQLLTCTKASAVAAAAATTTTGRRRRQTAAPASASTTATAASSSACKYLQRSIAERTRQLLTDTAASATATASSAGSRGVSRASTPRSRRSARLRQLAELHRRMAELYGELAEDEDEDKE